MSKDLGKVCMAYKKEYAETTEYEKLDVVTYEGSTYCCLVTGTIGYPPIKTDGAIDADHWFAVSKGAYRCAEEAGYSGTEAEFEEEVKNMSGTYAAATAAATSASNTETYMSELKTAIAELPDGTAVSEKVAEHTVEITDLAQEVDSIKGKKMTNDDCTNVGILTTGGVINKSFTDYHTSDFVKIQKDCIIKYNNVFPQNPYAGFCIYAEDKSEVLFYGQGTGEFDCSTLSTDACWLRMTTYQDDTYVLICAGISLLKAEEELNTLDEDVETLINKNYIIHIGEGQQYTTLHEGIGEAIKHTNSLVFVHPGTYDIVQEFTTFGGSFGCELGNGVHIIFLAGSYVKAIYDSSSASEWSMTYAQPFYSSQAENADFTIEGLDIEAENTRYCVHDELSGKDVSYVHKFINCRMKYANTLGSSSSVVCVQCIGGGLGKHGMIVIDGGYFETSSVVALNDTYADTPENSQVVISYHNGATDGCDSRITIKNIYAANRGYIRFGKYGKSTIVTPVELSGSSLGRITRLEYEASYLQTDNISVNEYDCEIRHNEDTLTNSELRGIATIVGLLKTDGTIDTTRTSYHTTDYVNISEYGYVLVGNAFPTAYKLCSIAFYDENKAFLGTYNTGTSYLDVTIDISTMTSNKFFPCKYARISVYDEESEDNYCKFYN